MPNYRIIPRDDVDAHEWLISNLATDFAVSNLRIDLPTIQFIAPTILHGDFERHANVLGLAQPGGRKIFLLHSLDPKTLAETCFHEVRHAYQFQRKRRTLDETLDEHDAEIFAWEMMIKLGQPVSGRILESLYAARVKGRINSNRRQYGD